MMHDLPNLEDTRPRAALPALKVFEVVMKLVDDTEIAWIITAKSAAQAWTMAGDDWNMRGDGDAIVKGIGVKECVYTDPRIVLSCR